MSRTLGLQEILVNSFDYEMSNVYTSIPGVIVAVHDSLAGMRVDVQPTINIRNEDASEVTPRPSVLNVPLQMPVTLEGGLTYPIKKGNPVWLSFSMRGLDVWKRGSGLSDTATDMRMFDIRDCVAIPGVYPSGLSPNSPQRRTMPHDTEDVVLAHNLGTPNEVEIRLKRSGDVYINSPNKVYVNCTDAEINAEDSVEITCEDYLVNCNNYAVNTVNYALVATGDSDNVYSQGTFRMQGSFVLNGVAMESHVHSGVISGGDSTQGPQN